MFEYPLDLHYSQTSVKSISTLASLNTLWIYTTLKPLIAIIFLLSSLNTLWIYTTLKPYNMLETRRFGLNTLWIYTTLKPIPLSGRCYSV